MFADSTSLIKPPFNSQAEIDLMVKNLSGSSVQTAAVVEKLHPNAYSNVDDTTWNQYWKILSSVDGIPVKNFSLNLSVASGGKLLVIGENTTSGPTGYMNSAVTSAEWAALQ